MKMANLVLMTLMTLLFFPLPVVAGGPFGAPQPIVKGAAGLHTAVGYWMQKDAYRNGHEQETHQNQIYSELGYGFRDRWEMTARVGMSDLRLTDGFRSADAATTTAKSDFKEMGKFFFTAAAKGFYPLSGGWGVGAFLQGSYYFSDFTDNVSGSRGGVPFGVEYGVKNLCELNFGIGLQATLPYGVKLYAGPHARYSEFKVSPSVGVIGLAYGPGEMVLENSTRPGGFAGIEVPLAKGFRLNLEGQYNRWLSGGAAVHYLY